MSYYHDAGQVAFEKATVLGKPALYTMEHVDSYSLPKNVYLYGLRGTEKEQTRPVAVKPGEDFYHAGTVILTAPLKFGKTGEAYLRGRFALSGEQASLPDFLAEQGVTPDWRAYLPQPISPEEADLLFSSEEGDEQFCCVGHVRADFDSVDKFWHQWESHHQEWNTPEFKAELQRVVDEQRECGMLRSFQELSRFCYAHPEARLGKEYRDGAYGFKVETERYQYYIRLTPVRGDNQLYLYTYDKAQQLAHRLEQEAGQGPDGQMMGGITL